MGRPNSYTPAIGEQICAAVAGGDNVYSWCKGANRPTRETVYQWLRKFSEFADNYARGRDMRADARFDKIGEVIEDMRDGEIDAQQARVEIDALKWMAGREAPKRYGDRLDVAGVDNAPLEVRHRVEFVAPKPRSGE